MNDYVEMMQEQGWKVYARGEKFTYCYCTDGVNIAYVQWSDGRPQVGTVHIPNKTTGTGFRYADDITPSTVRGAMITVTPHWADAKDLASVRKYKDWNEFHKSNSFNAQLVEVNGGKVAA